MDFIKANVSSSKFIFLPPPWIVALFGEERLVPIVTRSAEVGGYERVRERERERERCDVTRRGGRRKLRIVKKRNPTY